MARWLSSGKGAIPLAVCLAVVWLAGPLRIGAEANPVPGVLVAFFVLVATTVWRPGSGMIGVPLVAGYTFWFFIEADSGVVPAVQRVRLLAWMVAVTIGVPMLAWIRVRAEQELRAATERARALAAGVSMARERERQTLARELHDQLGQDITALKLKVAALRSRLVERTPELCADADELADDLDGALREVRDLARRLRPTILDDLGVRAAFEREAERVAELSDLRCRIEITKDAASVEPECALPLLRIFQEALTNVVRHAEATEVRAELALRDGFLCLSVRDNGIGFDPGAVNVAKTMGIDGMIERAELMGGTVRFRAGSNVGCVVDARVPASTRVDRVVSTVAG